jgi:hypothetical protein
MHGYQEQGSRDHRAVTYTQDAGDAGTEVAHGMASEVRCWMAGGYNAVERR